MTEAQKKEALGRLAAKWGDGFSEDEYRSLETSYRSMAAEYKGAITPRLELNLIDISKWRLERDKSIRAGDTAAAKRYTDMIKATMESEAMKVGDARSVEAVRADGLVKRLEDKGLMKDGVLLLKGVIEYIRNDKGHYQMSRDAVDAMLLSMVNAYRFNNGLSEIPELPDDVRIQDRLGEFMAAPSAEERSVMMDLGLAGGRGGN